ncbi:MAG: glycosyltransferase [Gemmatimonadetes bacterium]|nr:glycosyltransferase [Gemmatimonadota bacterium]
MDSGREWRGGQNQVRLLCRELAKAPDVVQRLITMRRSQLAQRVRELNVAVTEVGWTLSLDPRAYRQLAFYVLTARPDIVHAHDSHALTLSVLAIRSAERRRQWFFSKMARDFERPSVVATRRVDFHLRRWSAWRRVDRIIAISDAVKRVLTADGVNPRDISVVPSGIDPEEVRRAAATPLSIRARLGLPASTPLAVNVAALVDHKDQRTLIHAAQIARPLRPDLHWAIAGEGKLRRDLENQIRVLELSDRVHLVGYMDEADALIREADVFVMSSKEEGLGSVVLNALALEKPVIATAGGGIPEILPPEALVPIGEAEALARRVVEALAHPAPFPLPARFTAQAMAQGVLAVYRSLT